MINEIDKKIINMLYKDSSLSSDAIAKELDVNKGTIRNHLIKLKKFNIINNYTIRAKFYKLDMTEAIVGLAFYPENYMVALNHLRSFDFVKEVYRTSGDHSAIAMVISNSEEIESDIKKIKDIKGVKDVYPSFVQELIK